MIAAKDFRPTIGQSDKGVFVRVVHVPTGNEITIDPVKDEPVKEVIRRLTAELMGRVFNPSDFVIQNIRSKPAGFTRVIHIPSGKHRESGGRKTWRDLIEELVSELVAEELSQEKD